MPRKHTPLQHTPYAPQNARCKSKRAYVSEDAARRAADNQELLTHTELAIYQCPQCLKWHLTSKRRPR